MVLGDLGWSGGLTSSCNNKKARLDFKRQRVTIYCSVRKLYFLNFCQLCLVKYDCHLYTIEVGLDAVINLGVSQEMVEPFF